MYGVFPDATCSTGLLVGAHVIWYYW